MKENWQYQNDLNCPPALQGLNLAIGYCWIPCLLMDSQRFTCSMRQHIFELHHLPRNQWTNETWNQIQYMCSSVYSGTPYFLMVDNDTAYTSKEMTETMEAHNEQLLRHHENTPHDWYRRAISRSIEACIWKNCGLVRVKELLTRIV